MQDIHFNWLAGHPLSTVHDAWRAERAAFACEEEMQLLVQLAVLETDVCNDLLLKWGYVLNVTNVTSLLES